MVFDDINEEVAMFSSQMLDAAIGLVFVYFFLSLICSVIVEISKREAFSKKSRSG